MAEELDDGEFWLPSQFLTDDDIVMDFPSPKKHGLGSGFGSGSDLDLLSSGSVTGSTETGSTETESDEDELLAGLTHQFSRSTLNSKEWVLSSSPQSTLCGFMGKEEGSSRGSPNGPVSPNKTDGGATWDLLHKAAGEVARIKMTNETTTTTTKTSNGTGFFDCSNKGLLCPPPLPRTTTPAPPIFSLPQFPPLSHLQQMRMRQVPANGQQQFNRLTRPNSNNNNNRPLGLPPSAWPPLQAQNQPMPPMYMGQPGPKRESVGTGVFLPRRVTTTTPEPRKKSEGNPTKRTGKGSQSQHRRNSSKPPTVNQDEIQLPQEWTY